MTTRVLTRGGERALLPNPASGRIPVVSPSTAPASDGPPLPVAPFSADQAADLIVPDAPEPGAGQEPGPQDDTPPAAPLSRLIQRRENGIAVVTDAGLAMIERMAAEGHPMATIAKVLRVDRSTFKLMRRRDDRIEEALAQGYAANEHELVNILMAQARAGQIVPAIFLLKSRHGYREGEAREGGAAPNITINLPGALSPEQYMKMIEVKADGDH